MVRRYRDGVVPEVEPESELATDFDGLAERVAELLDGAQLTPALDEIWQRVRRLNRYVEERAPWQLAKDETKAGELDVALRSLAEGLRVVCVLLHAYMPASTEKALAALGQPETSLDSARYGSAPGGANVQELEPLFPKTQ
jgi:methionyl-tRNA synthetase